MLLENRFLQQLKIEAASKEVLYVRMHELDYSWCRRASSSMQSTARGDFLGKAKIETQLAYRAFFICMIYFMVTLLWLGSSAAMASNRPNILLVVLDDLGFTDLGFLGSEINTPNIDSLASRGMFFTQFHAAPTCSPSRAMLLSGVDNHLAGLGSMYEDLAPNQVDKPGYEGYLNFKVAALPEVLQDAGYSTFMTGKWHLGLRDDTGPMARGFDRSFALLQGGAGAFENMLPIIGPGLAKYREDGKLLEKLPPGFYSTAFYTDKMIEYLESSRRENSPFFAYLAYTSPHWPLQAPASSIARYKGKYDAGYEELSTSRRQRLQELDLISETVPRYPNLLPGEIPWGDLDSRKKQAEARKMEIYAAMVDDVDRHLGRLLEYLKKTGEFDNTIIVLLSDNGPEGHNLNVGWADLERWIEICCNNSFENMGKADSYVWYGPNWGMSGNIPDRMYKGYTSQGGVRVPALIYFPPVIPEGVRSNAIISVMDVMPTLLEFAGIEKHGGRFKGRNVYPMQGMSFAALARGKQNSVRSDEDYLAWELYGKRGLRQGDWKIVYEPYNELLEPRLPGIKVNQWQLYRLSDDPGEANDLAGKYPEVLERLITKWNTYEEENGVILPLKSFAY